MLPAQASLRSPAVTPWTFRRAVPSPGGDVGLVVMSPGAVHSSPWAVPALPLPMAPGEALSQRPRESGFTLLLPKNITLHPTKQKVA